MKANIETERLFLRPMKPDDAEAVFRWGGDPVACEYMYFPQYHRVEDVRHWLEGRNLDDPDYYDEGIVLKSTGELIGSGGLQYHPERNAWEIGYILRRDQWGNGYAVEMLMAIMEHIRRTRAIEAIDGIFAKENHRSQRVMEKLGMVYVADTQYEKLDGSKVFSANYYRRNFAQPAEQCRICGEIERIQQGIHPDFVCELEGGYVVLENHDRLSASVLFLCREHAKDIFQLSPELRAKFQYGIFCVTTTVEKLQPERRVRYDLYGKGPGEHLYLRIDPVPVFSSVVADAVKSQEEQDISREERMELFKQKLRSWLEC